MENPIPSQNLPARDKMVMVKLFSAIVGEARSVFSVVIDENATVEDLKNAINGDNSATITCDAKDLQFFLAKQPVEEEGGKELVPVYYPSAEEMEESLKWLPDEHRAALKLVKGESDDYINALTAGEQILASKTLATWFYAKNNMEPPSCEQIHVLVVVTKGTGGDQELESMLSHDPLTRIQEGSIRMWHNVAKEIREQDRKRAEETPERDLKQTEEIRDWDRK
ncbi:Crinkler (CRN) family protein [Phytophthora palmivora]|uniref:Crinkler (CRN) family protein n=1 Tax=Phytophthora palmivora TaxID=4796 RepID=A0A2P4XMV9_9STRA|nr:Crinkler (CRN) family protein [Phytophthora palmivora]